MVKDWKSYTCVLILIVISLEFWENSLCSELPGKTPKGEMHMQIQRYIDLVANGGI